MFTILRCDDSNSLFRSCTSAAICFLLPTSAFSLSTCDLRLLSSGSRFYFCLRCSSSSISDIYTGDMTPASSAGGAPTLQHQHQRSAIQRQWSLCISFFRSSSTATSATCYEQQLRLYLFLEVSVSDSAACISVAAAFRTSASAVKLCPFAAATTCCTI